MTIKMLQALNGDSFLVTIQGDKEYNILIDTGYEQTFDTQLLPLLQDISKKGEALSLCIITHIDNDHIGGAIPLFLQNDSSNKPKIIEIEEVWHNSFRHIHKTGNIANLSEQDIKQLVSIQQIANTVIEKSISDEENISAEKGSTLAATLLKGNYNWNLSSKENAICIENMPIHSLNDDVINFIKIIK